MPQYKTVLRELGVGVSWVFFAVVTSIKMGFLAILCHIPYAKELVVKAGEELLLVPKETFWDTWCTPAMLKSILHIKMLDLRKKAHLGEVIPNVTLVSLDGKTKSKLLDYLHGSRPLVLNFGSCT